MWLHMGRCSENQILNCERVFSNSQSIFQCISWTRTKRKPFELHEKNHSCHCVLKYSNLKSYNIWLVILITLGSHLQHVNILFLKMRFILLTFVQSEKTVSYPKEYTQICSHCICGEPLCKENNKSTRNKGAYLTHYERHFGLLLGFLIFPSYQNFKTVITN